MLIKHCSMSQYPNQLTVKLVRTMACSAPLTSDAKPIDFVVRHKKYLRSTIYNFKSFTDAEMKVLYPKIEHDQIIKVESKLFVKTEFVVLTENTYTFRVAIRVNKKGQLIFNFISEVFNMESKQLGKFLSREFTNKTSRYPSLSLQCCNK